MAKKATGKSKLQTASEVGKERALEMALAQIKKEFGESALMKLGDQKHMQVDVVSTGNIAVDAALGVGGLPRGRIIEIYGPESSGKTTLALHCVAQVQKGGGTAGIDISKFAVRAAAGRYKGIDFAVASLFHIPCAAESADVLTDVFAPIVPAEFRRVLKPGGVMILAVPGARHLYGMKEVLYAAPYENEERDTDYEGFAFLGSESVRREITVEGAENIEALFSMTPYYWKTDVAGGERLRRLDTLQTEIKFRFLVYRRL